MTKKLIIKGCTKCGGTLSRTGEYRVVERRILVEYSCIQCSKIVELAQELTSGDYKQYS